ncbi:MAG: biotin--[acetyl-CoA-carboxylase] ligase, partial [Bacteroidales bacterium]|nr:biotin--[acetyl-CoA-carboxylase] ligase [Bacteroidales bacterium]
FTIYTDFQSAGRGMGSNKWFSDRGENILASFYFEPDLPAAQQFVFNQYFAVTTRLFLSRYLPQVQIKWPNDMYVNGKKLAGDLTEHTLLGSQLRFSIAGIGININQSHFPAEIPHPTSLYLETGQTFEVETLLSEYWQLLHDHLEDLHHPELLQQAYLEHFYQMNEVHEYDCRGQRIKAAIQGIDNFGRLVLAQTDGPIHICGFKEVIFL